jgi:hypothetical protein
MDLAFAYPPEWTERAECTPMHADLYFPDNKNSVYDYGAARAVCRACPVQAECLSHALDKDERHGMWGGLSPVEREKLRQGPRVQVKVSPVLDDWNRAKAEGVTRAVFAERLGITVAALEGRLIREQRARKQVAA